MSNLYTLTKQIHELLPKINKKYGLKIEVRSDYFYSECFFNGEVDRVIFEHTCPNFYTQTVIEGKQKSWDNWKDLPAIQSPQLRQILVALQKILGENPLWRFVADRVTTMEKEPESSNYWDRDTCITLGQHLQDLELMPRTQAETLCQKWLDGLDPLFDREPEKVLKELLEILQNLLK